MNISLLFFVKDFTESTITNYYISAYLKLKKDLEEEQKLPEWVPEIEKNKIVDALRCIGQVSLGLGLTAELLYQISTRPIE